LNPRKPILCLDFDGTLSSYDSGWQGADIIFDDPVPGAIDFVANAVKDFEVHIFSSRSSQKGGIAAMGKWLAEHLTKYFGADNAYKIIKQICFPTHKPPAHVTIDDRAIQFEGVFPSLSALKAFKPWNRA
jgi:hypothetical protein